jgi:hypothetical protein
MKRIGWLLFFFSFLFYFPWVPHDGTVPLPPAGTLPPLTPRRCDLSVKETQLALLFISDPAQQHPALSCDAILADVARERAQDMATRNYLDHINPDGYGPNYLVEQAGFDLPMYYDQSDTGNNIESIGGGYEEAAGVWAAWLASPDHRTHVLGLSDFFARQNRYGVGYAYREESDHKHYWVILIAEQ